MKTEKLEIGFGLRKIETLQFAVFGDGNCDANKLTEQIAFSFNTSLENRILGCIFHYTLTYIEQPFLTIEIACHFNIEEQSWLTLQNTKKHQLILPKDFTKHLANITIGTARGILHAKTSQTPFNQFPIVLINLGEIFDNDAVINLDN